MQDREARQQNSCSSHHPPSQTKRYLAQENFSLFLRRDSKINFSEWNNSVSRCIWRRRDQHDQLKYFLCWSPDQGHEICPESRPPGWFFKMIWLQKKLKNKLAMLAAGVVMELTGGQHLFLSTKKHAFKVVGASKEITPPSLQEDYPIQVIYGCNYWANILCSCWWLPSSFCWRRVPTLHWHLAFNVNLF